MSVFASISLRAPARASTGATFFSWQCAAFVFAGALLALWPTLIFGGPLVFNDTTPYVQRGQSAVNAVFALFSAPNGAEVMATEIGEADSAAKSLRSAPYAVFLFVTSLFGKSFLLTAYAQNVLLLMAVWPFVAGLRITQKGVAIVAAAVVLFTSSLPWFGVFLMPDGFAAIVLLFGAALMGPLDRLGWLSRLLYVGLAAFAILTHYGNIPLAAGLVAVALTIRLLQWRLTPSVIAMGAAPLLLAMAANTSFSVATSGTPSVAPKRLPILLARSIQDGPAHWHLTEHCDTYNYAICEAFDGDIPETVGEMLFQGRGLRWQTPEMVSRIRDEEMLVLWRTFAEYPLEQTWALAGNAITQLVKVGLDEHYVGEVVQREDWFGAVFQDQEGLMVRNAFGAMHFAGYILAVVALCLMVLARPSLRNTSTAMALVVLAGIAGNAAIFGGLSYPTDRYGGRIAWVPLLLACLFVLDHLENRAGGWRRPTKRPSPSEGPR